MILDLSQPKPMDTAPRDGRQILVRAAAQEGGKKEFYFGVCWREDTEMWVILEIGDNATAGLETVECDGWWPLAQEGGR